MKHLFVFLLMLLSIPAIAQWENAKIDSVVSFQLPSGYERTKSDSENNFLARTAFGTILVFKAKDDTIVTPDIEKERHLRNYYDDYIKRVQSSASEGKITDEKDTLLGELKVKDFTLQIDSGSGVQYRKFRILHANNATYTFEFLYQDIHKEYADEECSKFFNSIKINETVSRADQFNAPDVNDSGQKTTLLIGAGVGILIFALVVFFILKRRKKTVS